MLAFQGMTFETDFQTEDMSMASVLVTVTLPTTRTDGSPFTAADYGGAHIFRADNGGTATQLGTVTAPGLTFTDSNVPAPDNAAYTASVFDTSTPPLESAQSAAADVTVPAPVAAPSAPTITAALQ